MQTLGEERERERKGGGGGCSVHISKSQSINAVISLCLPFFFYKYKRAHQYIYIRVVQNIRLTRQPVRPTTNPPVSCGLLNQAVWVRRVRPPKLRIELGYGLKNCQPAITRPTRLINNFTYIKKKNIYIYILVEIVKYLKLINSPNKFLQLINHQFRKQNWPSKNSLNKI